MRRGTTVLLGAVALAALVTACGGDAQDPASADPTGQSSSKGPEDDSPPSKLPTKKPAGDSSGGQPDGGPAFPADVSTQSAEGSGEWDLVLADVRVGDHDAYDRLVLEFTGTGTPGWSVAYVDDPVLDGSGEAVSLDGDAFLDIYASGTTYPQDERDYYGGPRTFRPDQGGHFVDVHVGGTFEGYTQVLAGIEGEPVPFRVFELADPPRLVVDVVDVD